MEQHTNTRCIYRERGVKKYGCHGDNALQALVHGWCVPLTARCVIESTIIHILSTMGTILCRTVSFTQISHTNTCKRHMAWLTLNRKADVEKTKKKKKSSPETP